MKQVILLIAPLLVASCGRSDQPQAPTAAESERLNEAEEMLNELAKEEGAAPKGAAPSNSD